MASTPSNPQPPPITATQIRILAQRRQYGVESVVYTPDFLYVEDAAGSPPSPYTVVMTGPDGLISPTLLPPSTPILLETNGVPNMLQSVLNLIEGSNITLTADALGGVTIAASGTVSTSFANITSGDNTMADMTVDTGATLTYVNAGVVNANEIGTINIDGNLPTHAGEVLVSQPGNTSAVWADPQVQGLYPVGSSVTNPPAYTPPTTIQPVLGGGEGPTGLLTAIQTTSDGITITMPADEADAVDFLTFSVNTGVVPVAVTARVPILSIQPQAGSLGVTLLLRKMRVVGNGGKALYELILNGNLTGSNFIPADSDSAVNYDVSATSIQGGRVVDSGYLNFGANEPDYVLNFGYAGSPSSPGTYTLVVTSMLTTGLPNFVSASFRWTENESL